MSRAQPWLESSTSLLLIPGANITPRSDARMLEAPLTDEAAEAVIANKIEELVRIVDRLQHIDEHSALFLLRNFIWIPKLQYLLRASPLYCQPGANGETPS